MTVGEFQNLFDSYEPGNFTAKVIFIKTNYINLYLLPMYYIFTYLLFLLLLLFMVKWLLVYVISYVKERGKSDVCDFGYTVAGVHATQFDHRRNDISLNRGIE